MDRHTSIMLWNEMWEVFFAYFFFVLFILNSCYNANFSEISNKRRIKLNLTKSNQTTLPLYISFKALLQSLLNIQT